MYNFPQLLAMFSQMKQNPSQLLGGLGIPNNIINDPQAIVRYLMDSGKISQEQYDQAVRMANGFKR